MLTTYKPFQERQSEWYYKGQAVSKESVQKYIEDNFKIFAPEPKAKMFSIQPFMNGFQLTYTNPDEIKHGVKEAKEILKKKGDLEQLLEQARIDEDDDKIKKLKAEIALLDKDFNNSDIGSEGVVAFVQRIFTDSVPTDSFPIVFVRRTVTFQTEKAMKEITQTMIVQQKIQIQ